MNGAESLVRTLLACGVDVCFANPGTSEMHFVAALDRAPGMRCVLCLAEGVVTGAADGYGRLTGRPAATLMHCGPGLGNGWAYLHNAKRAATPIVNIVGDQATYHAPLDPPLASDIEGLAQPVSSWVRKVTRTEALGAEAAAAVQAARAFSATATLILPSDVSWNDGGAPTGALPVSPRRRAESGAIREAARVLKQAGSSALLLLSGDALHEAPLADAHRIAAATKARVMAPTFNARISRGRGRFVIDCVPYPVDQAVALLADVKHVVLCGTGLPVAFFGYPGKPSIMTPNDAIGHVLAEPGCDLPEALARLADELGAPRLPIRNNGEEVAQGRGTVTPEGAAATLAALLPDHAILIDEAITMRKAFFDGTRAAPPHEWLQVPGGAIGGGLPLATGAAMGAPGRRVVVLQADGSAMYTIQALWTQAREKLDVTTIILSNREYAVLFRELAAVGATPGATTRDLFELTRPNLEWLGMANSMGVEFAGAETLERFADVLKASFSKSGPFLIELSFPPR